MKSRGRNLLALAIILAAGGLRLPVEEGLTADFRRQGLLSEPLDIGLREEIGQNSAAVALAGLRTLVATFAHLQATEAFSNQQWAEVEKDMETTVQLAPTGAYYWDMGAWHMAYSASSDRLHDERLPPLRAKAESVRWIEKGRDFLERGARNNPGDWRIQAALGNLLSDSFRIPDDAGAAEAYGKAIATGEAPPYVYRARLYAEARSGKHPEETLAEIRRLLEASGNRVPTLLCLVYTLTTQISPPADPVAFAVEIFGSEDKALRNLGLYFNHVKDRLPQNGVETAVRLLEGRQGISPEDPRSFIRQREKALIDAGLAQ